MILLVRNMFSAKSGCTLFPHRPSTHSARLSALVSRCNGISLASADLDSTNTPFLDKTPSLLKQLLASHRPLARFSTLFQHPSRRSDSVAQPDTEVATIIASTIQRCGFIMFAIEDLQISPRLSYVLSHQCPATGSMGVLIWFGESLVWYRCTAAGPDVRFACALSRRAASGPDVAFAVLAASCVLRRCVA